jgi:hypothetical protein
VRERGRDAFWEFTIEAPAVGREARQGKSDFFQRPSHRRQEDYMSNVVYRRCCGMDVHKDTIVVCVLPPDGGDGIPARKTYKTFRNDLIRVRVWLKQLKVTEIAMESTGVY